MAEDILQGSGWNPLLNTGDGEGVPQHMGRDGSADMRPIRDLLDHPLNGSDTDLQSIIHT
jgi:hypothetical protein